jgi:2-polyprenyl-6-methoxyphenol hydroxylase-like FAD-dependent oxidoreductase
MANAKSTSNTRTKEFLVVGAGIGGLAFASFLLLAQLSKPSGPRFKITILERSPSMRGLGQNIDIRSGGKELLHKLGIDDEVRAALTGEEGARFIDTTGRPWFSFAADKTGKVETATGEIEILRGRLAELLFRRCNALSKDVQSMGGEGVEFIFGDYLESIQQPNEFGNGAAQIEVTFAKSRNRRAFDIVVGADGLQSRTRNMAFAEPGQETIIDDESTASKNESLRRRNPHDTPTKDAGSESTSISIRTDQSPGTNQYLRPLDVYNAFFSIPASLLSDIRSPPPQTGTQFADGWRIWYHAPGRKSIMVRPADDKSRLTVLMIILDPEHKDERFRSVAVIGDDRKATVLKQKQLMAEYYQDAGWECAKLVEGMQAADDFYYDLVAQVKMDKWSRGRVCLLGDAA